jgi:hypothetical protein
MAAALPAHSADVVDPDMMGLGLMNQEAASPRPSHDSSLCRDGMEEEPEDDDLVPMPASADSGCSVVEDTIAT